MVESIVSLRSAAMALIFCVSLGGFLLPRNLETSHDDSDSSEVVHPNFLRLPAFRLLKMFSAGVILGVAMLHLLDDAFDKLSQLSVYPGDVQQSLFFNLVLTVFLE